MTDLPSPLPSCRPADAAPPAEAVSTLAQQPWWHSAFYRFTALADPDAVADALRRIGAHTGVLGSLVVAPEGVSGAVAGSAAAVAAFEAALRGDDASGGLASGGLASGAFAGLVFKHSRGATPPFARLAVLRKPELVALGLPGVGPLGAAAEPASPANATAATLDPVAWRARLARDDVVLIDNRNRFEHRLGRFRGAAEPPVANFREFADWVLAQAPGWRAARRPVAMYCTGGIRCDKTLAWMQGLGLDVATLDGGVLAYLQHAAAQPGGEPDPLWQGECFVFDNRIALDAQLRETATGAAAVYDPRDPDEAWRLERALRLEASAAAPGGASIGASQPAPAGRSTRPEGPAPRAVRP